MLRNLGVVLLSLVVMMPAAALATGRASEGLYRVELLDQADVALRVFDHRGHTWALCQPGQRYRIRVHNLSPRRVEAVVSVDGRDAVDGQPAHFAKPGYVIAPHGSVTLEGFRLSMQDVAAFRFGPVAASYAAQMGDARHVGVIGVAIFPERMVRPVPHIRCATGHCRTARSTAAVTAPSPSPKAAARGAEPAGAGGNAVRSEASAAARTGLGTTFGEIDHAPALPVAFSRAAPHHPDGILVLRYNDRTGLLAMGIDVDGLHWRLLQEEQLRLQACPFADVGVGFSVPPAGWRPSSAPPDHAPPPPVAHPPHPRQRRH